MNITEEEITEMSKQCGAMKHYFRDELLTFARLIEQRQEDEIEALRQRVAELERSTITHDQWYAKCNDAKYAAMAAEEEAKRGDELKEQLTECKKERDHWKANHDNRVEAARLLHYRLDLPLERVKAYEKYVEMQERLAEVEKERDKYRKQVQLGFKHLIETECIDEVSINEGYTLVEHLRLQMVRLLKERDQLKASLYGLYETEAKLVASQAREQKMRNALLVAQECLSEAHGAVTDSASVTFWFDEALSTVDAALARSTTEDCSAVQAKGEI